MNFSWPHGAAGKTKRRGVARAWIVGVSAVAVAGAAALAAPSAFATAKHATTTKMSAVSGRVGSKLTLAAKVTGSTPKGTVKFIWGKTTLCSASLSNGTAKCPHTFTGVGSLRVEALYEGNSTHKASSSVATVKVLALPTTTKVTSAGDPFAGQIVVLKATVASSTYTATGHVTFSDAGGTLGTVPVVNGKATLNYSWKADATYKVTGKYSGDSRHSGSSGTDSVVVGSYNTTTVITIDADAYSPTLNWETAGPVMVPFTVTDNTPGGPAPTGTVTISDPSDIPDQPANPSFAGCTGTLTPGANGVSTGECPVTTTPGVASPPPYAVWGFVLMRATYNPKSTAFAASNTGDTEYKILNYMQTATAVTPDAATAGTAVTLMATVLPSGTAAAGAHTKYGNLLAAYSEQLETGGPGVVGDTVSFTANGNPIAGCQNVTILWNAATLENYVDCSYTPTADGTVAIAAAFSGDEYTTPSTGTENLTVTG